MAVLGGKSKPKLKNLKSFIKVELSFNILLLHQRMNIFFQDSHLVQVVCKDLIQQESMVKDLEDKTKNKHFFLADPGSEIF